MNESQLKKFFKPAIFEADDLHEYFTWWDNVTSAQVKEDLECLDKATSERELQAFLEGHPNLLIQHLGGGHGRWVVPQKRLGSEFVTDFVIGERHSFGFQWQAVEIESPLVPLSIAGGSLYKISRSISIRMIGLSEEASTGSKPSNGPALNTKTANSTLSRVDGKALRAGSCGCVRRRGAEGKARGAWRG